MASPPHIDIESLLQPISDDNPSGLDIRDDPSPASPYQTVKNARNQARAAERQSIHDGESQEASGHWQHVVELAPQIIQEHAKDLEVASWYAEAMIRRNGFSGLRDAFALIDGLIENFWEQLHPMPDDYGMETRVSCLSGLNGEGAEGVLIAPIRKVPLTDGWDPGPFSLWQYHQALEAQKSPDDEIRRDKIAKLGFSTDDIEKSVNASDEQFYVDIRDDLTEAISLYRATGTKLDEHCGIHDAPPTRTIIEILEECLGVINHIGKAKFPIVVEEETQGDGAMGTDSNSEGQPKVGGTKGGPISSREEAFRQLGNIAEYFRKTEPHSPVSYVLQKAVKWGNMPLNELIGELITDNSSRERYSELTGVEMNEE